MDERHIQKRRNRSLFINLDVIVIDEVSMVRADIIDHIHLFLQINRDDDQPFGGVQMIFFGDLFQLPPVVATPFERHFFQSTYDSPYFFDAHVFTEYSIDLNYIEMTNVYRQEERGFIRLLDDIRQNDCDYDDVEFLNTRYQKDFERSDGYITLCSRNAISDRINQQELSQIEQPQFQYVAEVAGSFDPRLYPTDLVLRLKAGAQVMMLKNDTNRRYVNGSIARVETLSDENVGVSLLDASGKRLFIEVPLAEWEVLKYKVSAERPSTIETEVVGIFRQFPVRLAWAVTIHKSQGKTFDHVIIDLGKGAFEHGQTYVALSRCKTFEGIILANPIRMRDIWVDPRIIDFYNNNIR